MSDLVSIIVPIYNVEKYLSQCLESIINQTYKNIEILLINDGSTDNSYEICSQYAKQDNRINLINKENGGSASAKNYGLKIAKGDYIGFVDSDDFINLNMIEYMVQTIKSSETDIIQCDFISMYKDTRINDNTVLKENTISAEGFLKLFLKEWKSSLFWNKLFKKEVIEGVYFNEGRCIDDEFFTYKCVINSKSIAISNKQIYNYRMRKSGVMKSEISQKQILRDRIDYLRERYSIISKIYKSLDNLYLEHMITYLLIISRDYYIDEDILNYMKDILKSLKYKILIANINVSTKLNIIKLMISDSRKYINYKKNINKVDYGNYFE